VFFFLIKAKLSLSQSTEMILIPPGVFTMGGSSEKDQTPIHKVFLDRYYIDIKEVNQNDFQTVMGFNPSLNKRPHLPVEFVNWYEAQEYCHKIDKRLPTEAEWEKAIRGNTQTKFYWGKQISDQFSWFKENSKGKSHIGGSKNPNQFGLYDMSGNVWEWVSDWYDPNYYRNSPHFNPKGPKTGQFKVQRGGSWSNTLDYHTSSYRMVYGPLGRDEFNGFRCVKTK
tara:strand:+ start:203 stop:877 length:675 start_codon:yes stop_codon:yes gene_type:complete